MRHILVCHAAWFLGDVVKRVWFGVSPSALESDAHAAKIARLVTFAVLWYPATTGNRNLHCACAYAAEYVLLSAGMCYKPRACHAIE